MRKYRTSGSVRGAPGNRRVYRDDEISFWEVSMKEYKRKYPMFSLCGLNCCLCPRYHTDGSSKCPGCGGANFTSCHPSCPVISCNKKHDNVEFCFECSLYPCQKYESLVDSFISKRNVLQDQKAAKADHIGYLNDLNRKFEILLDLIKNYNDGKSKGFYCLACNLLPLSTLEGLIETIHSNGLINDAPDKEKTEKIKILIKEQAACLNIELVLRK